MSECVVCKKAIAAADGHCEHCRVIRRFLIVVGRAPDQLSPWLCNQVRIWTGLVEEESDKYKTILAQHEAAASAASSKACPPTKVQEGTPRQGSEEDKKGRGEEEKIEVKEEPGQSPAREPEGKVEGKEKSKKDKDKKKKKEKKRKDSIEEDTPRKKGRHREVSDPETEQRSPRQEREGRVHSDKEKERNTPEVPREGDRGDSLEERSERRNIPRSPRRPPPDHLRRPREPDHPPRGWIGNRSSGSRRLAIGERPAEEDGGFRYKNRGQKKRTAQDDWRISQGRPPIHRWRWEDLLQKELRHQREQGDQQAV